MDRCECFSPRYPRLRHRPVSILYCSNLACMTQKTPSSVQCDSDTLATMLRTPFLSHPIIYIYMYICMYIYIYIYDVPEQAGTSYRMGVWCESQRSVCRHLWGRTLVKQPAVVKARSEQSVRAYTYVCMYMYIYIYIYMQFCIQKYWYLMLLFEWSLCVPIQSTRIHTQALWYLCAGRVCEH